MKDIPAFPSEHMATVQRSGMTLRDYFAAKAMRVAWEAYDKGYTDDPEDLTSSVASHAYQIADAMLEARK